jgi:hypothetical protein
MVNKDNKKLFTPIFITKKHQKVIAMELHSGLH